VKTLDFDNLPKSVRDELCVLLSRGKADIGWQDILSFAKKHWVVLTAVGILGVVSYLVIQSGLAASLLNKKKRQLFVDDEIDPPPPGTPLLESLGPYGIIEHSGLYLGRSAAAELHGDGVFKKVTLSRFLNGDEEDPDNPRCGEKIFAACDLESKCPLSLGSATDFAAQYFDSPTDYNILTNNCHRFTASCILGELQKPLVWTDLIINGAYSISKLEDVISQKINGGRDICWISVRRTVPSFDFVVSPRKR